MATIATAQAGVWSAGATWTGGVAPTTGDVADIDHAVTLDQNATVDQLDIASGVTLTLGSGGSPFDLTGMTASCLGTGTISGEAGCDLKWNSASDLGTGNVNVTMRGTSGARCTIENVGAGYFTVVAYADWDCEYTDIHTVKIFSTGNVVTRLIACDLEGTAGFNAYVRPYGYRVILKNGWISGFGNTTYGAGYFGYTNRCKAILEIENMVWGADRDSNSQANGKDWYVDKQLSLIYAKSVRLLSTTTISRMTSINHPSNRIFIDNYGFDGTTGTRGVWYTDAYHYTAQRSTTNPYSGETYCALVTPKTGCGDAEDEYADLELWVPIETGDDIEVTTHGKRNGLSDDCAELIIDEEEAWFTSASHAPTLTNNNTYYEFTQSASGAAGSSEKGSVRIILRVKENNAADTFQWGGVTVVAGDKTYVFSMQQGSMGMPIADEPSGGGLLVHPGTSGGARG